MNASKYQTFHAVLSTMLRVLLPAFFALKVAYIVVRIVAILTAGDKNSLVDALSTVNSMLLLITLVYYEDINFIRLIRAALLY